MTHKIDLDDFLDYLKVTNACLGARTKIWEWGLDTLEEIFDRCIEEIPYQTAGYLLDTRLILDANEDLWSLMLRKRGRIISSLARRLRNFRVRWRRWQELLYLLKDSKHAPSLYTLLNLRFYYFGLGTTRRDCVLRTVKELNFHPAEQVFIADILADPS